jgi:RimJ/RimL family protein N-acetyltransferase
MTAVRAMARRVPRAFRYRLYSPANCSVVLRRDLTQKLEPAPAQIPITVRPADDADLPRILAAVSELTGSERAGRERFLALGIGTCYVAVTDADEICYMQWLAGPEDNDLLRAHTHLPLLEPGEALLENAFTPTGFRGRGIMASAMAQIAARASERGARWVLTVVAEDNIASIKGCRRAGFDPYLRTGDQWRLLRRHIRYTDVPSGEIAIEAVASGDRSTGAANGPLVSRRTR